MSEGTFICEIAGTIEGRSWDGSGLLSSKLLLGSLWMPLGALDRVFTSCPLSVVCMRDEVQCGRCTIWWAECVI